MNYYTLRIFEYTSKYKRTLLETLTTKKKLYRSPNHETLRKLASGLGSDEIEVYKSDRNGNYPDYVKSISFDYK